MSTNRPYVGRFAPSPTGRLHLGSMVVAVASWLDAKVHGGVWLVWIENLDPPREVKGAADDILKTLEGFGLEWDGQVVYQSERHELYGDWLERMKEQNWSSVVRAQGNHWLLRVDWRCTQDFAETDCLLE